MRSNARLTERRLRQMIRALLIFESDEALRIGRVETPTPVTTNTGNTVIIRGSGFTDGISVTFKGPSGKETVGRDVTLVDPGTLRVYLPALVTPGNYGVTLKVGGKMASLANALKVVLENTGSDV